jgi:hypothetical protein
MPIAIHIFNLGIRGRWSVIFMPQMLYLGGKSPQYPLDRRLGGPQNRSHYADKEKEISAPCQELSPSHAAHNQVTTLTELPQLPFS